MWCVVVVRCAWWCVARCGGAMARESCLQPRPPGPPRTPTRTRAQVHADMMADWGHSFDTVLPEMLSAGVRVLIYAGGLCVFGCVCVCVVERGGMGLNQPAGALEAGGCAALRHAVWMSG